MPSSDAQLDRGGAEGGAKCPGDSPLYPSGGQDIPRGQSLLGSAHPVSQTCGWGGELRE